MGKWYVRVLEAPTHIERALFSLRTDLIQDGDFTPFPPLPFLITAFSETPFEQNHSRTLYLEDLLGEGGLFMDQLIQQDRYIYWGSTKLNTLLKLNPLLMFNTIGITPFSCGKGFLMGEGKTDISLTPIKWKKARIKDYLVDFSPERIPGEKVDWPLAVSWVCLSD